MRQILALGVLALLTAAAVAPWPGAGSNLFAAMLPAAFLHYWALRRASVIPEIAVFFSGLAVDIVSGGPAGFWTLVYVSAWLTGLLGRAWADIGWKPGRWALYAVGMTAVAGVIYGLGNLLGSPVASLGELSLATVWLVAIYPALASQLRLIDGPREGRPLGID